MPNEMESQMARPEANSTEVVAKKKATVRISLPPKPSAKQTIKIVMSGSQIGHALPQIKPPPVAVVAAPLSVPKQNIAPPPFSAGGVGAQRIAIKPPNLLPVGIISPVQNGVVQRREPPPQGIPTDPETKQYVRDIPPAVPEETGEISPQIKANNPRLILKPQPTPDNTQSTPNKEEDKEEETVNMVVYNASRVADVVLLTVALMVMIVLFFVIRWNVNKLDGASSGMPQKTPNIVTQKTKKEYKTAPSNENFIIPERKLDIETKFWKASA